MEMGGSVVAVSTHDIENPLETLKMDLDSLSSSSSLCCINRVPDRIRRVREEAYTPHVISIGPLHHANEALKPMEVQKKLYLKSFMERTKSKLNDYIEKIRGQEGKLRKYYAETIVLTGDQFVRMVLVDAIFIIEFMLRYWEKSQVSQHEKDEEDYIFGRPRILGHVAADLLMLENQLPFFILEDLFPAPHIVLCGIPQGPESFQILSVWFLYDHVLVELAASDEKLSQDSSVSLLDQIYSSKLKVQHFVDLLKKLWLDKSENWSEPENNVFMPTPSIEKLHQSGVKFEVGSTKKFNKIQFNQGWFLRRGILTIPKLMTGNLTELLLRNLIAFEQCSTSGRGDDYISAYIIIMNELVDTPNDVDMLETRNIVENYLGGGDKELSKMINSLSTGIVYDKRNFYYGKLSQDLDKFCKSQWRKWMANLREKYFHTPWSAISCAAAVFLLIFTGVQTFSSVYQLYDIK